MAERKVDLVIKARDEATKSFKSVEASLEALQNVQQAVARSAGLMGNALDGSESDVKQLQAAFDKGKFLTFAQGFDLIAKEANKVKKVLREQQEGLGATRKRFIDLSQQLREAKKALASYQQQGDGSDKNAENVKNAARAVRLLQREYAKVSGQLKRQKADLAATVEAYNRVDAAAAASGTSIRQMGVDLRAQADAAAISKRAAEQEAEALRKIAMSRPSGEEQQRLALAFRNAGREGKSLRETLAQIGRELTRIGPSTANAAGGFNRAAGGAYNMRRALQAFYGDSRRALSLMQRLRGEVLSLTASFVGFYAIFNTGRSFLESFQQLEAATNRLQAAFDQDTGKAADELKYLRDEAERLGVSFNTLSDNYSKFLISGQAAGLEVGELRTIFRQVTEAGRVLNLTNDQISRTFVALSQIAGKGVAGMEEIRQQIGDQIPGAVGILAKALGYTEDNFGEFFKRVENGALDSRTALLALGNGLEETFGGQLENSLNSVNAQIGRLQNLLFQRRLTAANAGLIQGIETTIAALNEFLESEDGVKLFEAIGAAMGNIIEIIPSVVEHFDVFLTLLKGFVALKLAQTFRSAFAALETFGGKVDGVARSVRVLNVSLYRISPAALAATRNTGLLAASLRGVVRVAAGLRVAILGISAAFGGPLGIAITLASAIFVEWFGRSVTAVDELEAALGRHDETIREIGRAYREAAGDADKFQEALDKINETDLELDLRQIRKELAELKKKSFFENLFGDELDKIKSSLLDAVSPRVYADFALLAKQFRDGTISATEFKKGIDSLAKANEDFLAVDGLRDFRDYIDNLSDAEDEAAKLEATLALKAGTATEAQMALLGLAEAAEEAGDKMDPAAKQAKAFEDALRKLAEHIPGLKEQFDRFDAIQEIEADFKAAMEAADGFTDAAERAAAAGNAISMRNDAYNALYDADVKQYSQDSGVGVAAAFLRDKEGFRATPYWDVNAYRVGYGSDTVTLADGTIQKVTQGMRVSVEDANRDLIRRISTEYLPKARSQVGAARFDSFTAQQQGALTSIAYNYGSLPERILDAVRTGTDEQIVAAIQSLATDNGGVNARRRSEEAALFRSREGHGSQIEAAEEQLKLEEDFHEKVKQRIEDEEFELSIQGKALQDREVAKALREAELEAQKAGVKLTQEERAELEKVTREKFAQQAAEEAREEKLKEAQAIEEQITMLQEQRRFLQDQQTHQEGQGDLVGAAKTAEQLEGVETQLDSMIEKALAFWEALGGEGSAAAIQKLQITQAELQRVESTAVTTGEQMNTMIADKFTGAFDSFAQAIANGENAWEAFRTAFQKAAAEFLIQIAQMIIRQALLNALQGGQGANGGIGGMLAGGINALVAHGGGVAGRSGVTRSVNPAVFAGAYRYHGGGVAGLRPDEVPAILQAGEEIVTANDPRNRANGGLGGGNQMPTIINAVDGSDALEQALATPRGKEALVNYMRANRGSIKAVLG